MVNIIVNSVYYIGPQRGVMSRELWVVGRPGVGGRCGWLNENQALNAIMQAPKKTRR